MKKLFVSCIAVMALGCGGDDDAKSGMVNEGAAKSNAMQTISAVTTLTASTDPNAGQTAAMQLMGVAQGAQGIVTPSMGQDNCACEGTTCTFQDCGQNGSTMTGTISWGDGTVTSDISYSIDQAGTTYNLTVKTDLTVTETSIDGTVSSTGSGSVSGGGTSANFSWSNLVDFMAVTYSGGQPTGGSVYVDATTTVNGETYGGQATVSFP